MKIKDSLKVYVIRVSVALGILLAVIAGSYSAYNLYLGIDLVVKGIMLDKADTEHPVDGKPVVSGSFVVASKWNDLPPDFQLKFEKDHINAGELSKYTETYYDEEGKYNRFIYLVLKRDFDDVSKYVAVKINKAALKHLTNTLNINLLPQFFYVMLFVCMLLSLFLIGLFLILRRITKPVEELKMWAMSLRGSTDLANIPDFKFSELNMMARAINNSLSAVQKSVSKEKDFIRYASHELRTPIAIIRSNAELMNKMIANDMPKERLQKNLQRIANNSVAMSNLCESLLWLNHRKSTELKESMTSFGVLVEQVVNEQRYLLEGKTVEVEINVDTFECLNFSDMCKIVITNLVRNAFQHTLEGEVIIRQHGKQVEVINRDANTHLCHETTGFGLGLLIIKKICDQYYWTHEEHVLVNGRAVKVTFG